MINPEDIAGMLDDEPAIGCDHGGGRFVTGKLVDVFVGAKGPEATVVVTCSKCGTMWSGHVYPDSMVEI